MELLGFILLVFGSCCIVIGVGHWKYDDPKGNEDG